MSTLTFSHLNVPTSVGRTQLYGSRVTKAPIFFEKRSSIKHIHLRCSKNLTFDSSLQYAKAEESNSSIIKGNDIVDAIDTEEEPQTAVLHSESGANFVDLHSNESFSLKSQTLIKWPMWLLGPLILLVTGMVPTLWLPLSSVFLGSNVAGLLSLVGLDCLFNMGAMIFLLMADACARATETSWDQIRQRVPQNYRLWNIGASIMGFVIPLLLLLASSKGTLQPHLSYISFLVLVGPYLLLLSIQVLTEALTWYWRSPAWLITPVVYEGYRILQLMRGIPLAGEVGAPVWMVQTLRGLVSWWVLVLGIQLMRVSWFVGSTSQN
ncbi:cytochrome P450 family protein [Rhynchospora pubera]|uniref:Cytochrome P450 family protein n=1 Tax=Rhynchospora pubera TaxID=906938 RepID=A0AAV8H741_9POAL|nr:cytochrome P450 family protein [Rhynchospora pubera]